MACKNCFRFKNWFLPKFGSDCFGKIGFKTVHHQISKKIAALTSVHWHSRQILLVAKLDQIGHLNPFSQCTQNCFQSESQIAKSILEHFQLKVQIIKCICNSTSAYGIVSDWESHITSKRRTKVCCYTLTAFVHHKTNSPN